MPAIIRIHRAANNLKNNFFINILLYICISSAACRHGKVEQMYIKIKCGHSILHDIVNAEHNNVLDIVVCWRQ
jgi:predicted ABC-type ATPase